MARNCFPKLVNNRQIDIRKKKTCLRQYLIPIEKICILLFNLSINPVVWWYYFLMLVLIIVYIDYYFWNRVAIYSPIWQGMPLERCFVTLNYCFSSYWRVLWCHRIFLALFTKQTVRSDETFSILKSSLYTLVSFESKAYDGHEAT